MSSETNGAITISGLKVFFLRSVLGWFAAMLFGAAVKVGKTLVSQGYITQEQLYQALKEQSLRIGEVLVQEGRITPKLLLHALAIQKKHIRFRQYSPKSAA